MDTVQKIVACRACGSDRLYDFFDLGKQPLANSLLARPDAAENIYPLSLSWCMGCRLVQLNHTIDPKVLFSSYVWVTGTSSTAKEYADRFYAEVVGRAERSREGYILEVASNDGTFLTPFKREGYAVVGIDPAANIVREANEAGIETECAFFGEACAEDIVRRRGRARVVFARNVLPHVANTRDFVLGLRAAVDDDGLVIIEAHDATIIAEELHYDSIYHEHLCYFTFTTLERLLRSCGLFVADMTWSPISGGSMVIFARPFPIAETKAVTDCREREHYAVANTLPRWEHFAREAEVHRDRLRMHLRAIGTVGGSVVAYGASARSSTLLNFCGIDSSLVSVIADKNAKKQGLYTAGTRISIESPERVFARKPSHVLLLAWNFEAEIRDYLKKEFGFTKTFIIPLPRMPRIE